MPLFNLRACYRSTIFSSIDFEAFFLVINLIIFDQEEIFLALITYQSDLTVSKRPGASYQIEIHFAVVNHLYLLFSFVNLVKT